jgi:hypothetical protein
VQTATRAVPAVFKADAIPASHALWSRVTDDTGRTQPFGGGYEVDAVQRVPAEVMQGSITPCR